MAPTTQATSSKKKPREPKRTAHAPSPTTPPPTQVFQLSGNWAKVPYAFFALTIVPPLSIVAYILPIEIVATTLAFWMGVRFVLRKVLGLFRLSIIAGHAYTFYVAFNHMPAHLLPDGADPLSSQRLLPVAGLTIAMGIAYRNTSRFLSWALNANFEYQASEGAGQTILGESRPTLRVPLANAESKSPRAFDSEFVVKVQLPMGSGLGEIGNGLGMCYDERRTVKTFVSLESDAQPSETAAMVRLIATDGGSGGLRAYFMAKRSGEDLLIFVDRVVPPPGKW